MKNRLFIFHLAYTFFQSDMNCILGQHLGVNCRNLGSNPGTFGRESNTPTSSLSWPLSNSIKVYIKGLSVQNGLKYFPKCCALILVEGRLHHYITTRMAEFVKDYKSPCKQNKYKIRIMVLLKGHYMRSCLTAGRREKWARKKVGEEKLERERVGVARDWGGDRYGKGRRIYQRLLTCCSSHNIPQILSLENMQQHTKKQQQQHVACQAPCNNSFCGFLFFIHMLPGQPEVDCRLLTTRRNSCNS